MQASTKETSNALPTPLAAWRLALPIVVARMEKLARMSSIRAVARGLWDVARQVRAAQEGYKAVLQDTQDALIRGEDAAFLDTRARVLDVSE